MPNSPDTLSISAAQQALRAGKFNLSLSYCQELLNNKSKDVDALYLAAVCCRYLKNYDRALSYLTELKLFAPEYGRAYQEQGHCLREQKKFSAACREYSDAVKRNPGLLVSWQQIAALAEKATDIQVAQTNIQYLTSLPQVLLSVISFMHENKIAKAEQLCRQFLQVNPKNVEGMRLLAKIGEQANVLDDAEFLLESCLAYEPENHWARFDYVNVLHRRQKFSLAHQHACKLHKAMPADISVKITLANQKSAIGEFLEAIALYEEIESLENENPLIPLLKGHALKTMGKQQLAIESYQRAIYLDSSFGDAYWSLANLKTFHFSKQQIQVMKDTLALPSLTHKDAVHLNFSLGKALEDNANYAQAFDYYQKGNVLKKEQGQYCSEKMIKDFNRQQQFFTPQVVKAKLGDGCQSEDPIFILGLPRAGSTLLEQILSSHSQIDGTLELPNILSYVHELNGRKYKNQQETQYPDVLKTLSSGELRKFGERYIEETKMFRHGAPYFIDKMPNNFRHIGLIKLILPKAKIIDARRDAMACCFSVFKQLFAEGQEFSYDLKDVGEYYSGYVNLMNHWHRVFPEQILTVNYQNVINDTENQIISIFDYLGLPVESNCFEFHKTKRAVRTASSEQVRQPIYKDSLAQWQHFEAFLSPLKSSLTAT